MKLLIYILFPIVVVLVSCNSIAKRNSDSDNMVNVENYVGHADDDSIYKAFSPNKVVIATYPNFEVECAYQYNGLKFIIGIYLQSPKDLPNNDYGIRLLVVDSKGELIYRLRGSDDSRTLTPTFYKLDNESPIFILAEIGDEGGSWGNVVFMISGNVVKSIGNLNLAVPLKNDDLTYSVSNVGDYTRITKKGKDFHFDFNVDTLYYDPLGKNEKSIDGRKVYYLYDNKCLVLIEK